MITAVTLLAMPQNRVIFGVLTLLGTCMILMIPIHKIVKGLSPMIGMCISVLFFVLLRNVSRGYIGFEDWNLCTIPSGFYRNYLTAYLGFPQPVFFSTDYFPVIPWIFLFLIGYFLYGAAEKRKLFKFLMPKRVAVIGWIGKHSFPIYLLHQPVLYVVLTVLFGRNH